MNILITGGAGFIGSHLAAFHLNKGDEVCVLDNLSTGSRANIEPFLANQRFYFAESDLMIWDGLSERILWADRIYHLAAIVGMYHLLSNPVTALTTNILGCERVLRLMTKVKSKARLIIASTSEVYGPSDKAKLSEEDVLLFKASANSKWGYAASKFTAELFALTYARSKALNVTIPRLFNTIGPRQKGEYGMVVPRFIDQALRHQPITVYGSGEQTRSFCDVRDTVVALDRIADTEATLGELINLGCDQPITMNQLANRIKRLANSDSVIQHIPYEEAYGQAYEDIMTRRPDLCKLHELTSYPFQWDLERTLYDLIHLQKMNYNLER